MRETTHIEAEATREATRVEAEATRQAVYALAQVRYFPFPPNTAEKMLTIPVD